MTAPKLPRPLGTDDHLLPSIYDGRSAEERAGLARAEAIRDARRDFRRGVGEIIHRLDVMAARERLRRRFVRR